MPQFSYTMPVETKLWHNSGLEFLLIPEEERRDALKAKKSSAKTASASMAKNQVFVPNSLQNQQGNNQKFHAVSAQATQTGQSNQANSNSEQVRNISQRNNEMMGSPRSSEEARERENPHANSLYPMDIIQEYEWNKEWKDIYAKLARDGAKVAWSYTGFHADFAKTSSALQERQDTLRRIVTRLGRPNGTHVFIPYDLPNEPGSLFKEDDASFYWSMVAKLKVRNLLIFGSHARDTLSLPKKGKYTSFNLSGHKVYILPDLNRISKDEEQSLFTYIDTQLKSVNI